MTERSVRIAISIKDRVAQQLASTMIGNTGAHVEVCEDAAEILAVADSLQGIVLGLDASPEDTFDTLGTVRKQLPTIPIGVITDASGQRHTQRAEQLGATHVIPHHLLQMRVDSLVQEMAQHGGITDWGVRSPGWVPNNKDQGYDIESMDLEAWLSIPGNRRLLGMEENPEKDDTTSPDAIRSKSGAEAPVEAPIQLTPAFTPRGVAPPSVSGPSAWCAAPPTQVSPHPLPAADASGAECPHVVQCRVRHEAQNAAILEAHLQREKRLRADIKAEYLQSLTRQIAASEAKLQDHFDENLVRATEDIDAAVRRFKIMSGVMTGIGTLAVLTAIAVVWQSGILP
jgi:CheY-like chemotaxis protein